MYITENLIEEVFNEPYQKGFRNLRILTGYSSAAFLYHIVSNYPEINIELIIGMASKDGIRKSDHIHFNEIIKNNSRVSVKYHKTAPGIHTKIYYWFNEGIFEESITYIGSANFSWNGFRDQVELLAKTDYLNVEDVFKLSDVISCTDSAVAEYINFYAVDASGKNQPNTSESVHSFPSAKVSVKLPLLLKNDTAIHERSGLNWGQREGREPNQAYIPVPSAIHQSEPDFFPPYKHPFTLITDDGTSFLCIMSQANRKAIETSLNTSILGKYFRNRLDVPYGEKVEVKDVLNYGKTFVEIYKIDSETFFMNFRNNPLFS